MKQTRIFLACADERLKIGMLMLLDNQPDMVIAGISDRLTGLAAQIKASKPDALVMEWEDTLIVDRITNIHNLARPPVIIYLSNRAKEKEKIIAAGADYFVMKNAPPDELLKILKDIPRSKPNHPDMARN